MPVFGTRSKAELGTAHPDLQRLFNEVIKHFDCVVIEGFRGKEAQEEAFRTGKTKLHWPHGNHNKLPSMAVDVAPYPLNWKDTDRFYFFAGYVKGIAATLGLNIRYGGDWDNDTQLHDQTFFDLVHYELIP